MNHNFDELIAILEETRLYLAKPDNGFLYSTWNNSQEALREFDELMQFVYSGTIPDQLKVLFLPTADLQEVSIDSGWGQEFLLLAERFDNEVAKLKK